MKSRTRSRKPASIGSNHSSRRPTAISASEPRTGNFVLLLVMAWSPPAHNAGIVWVSAPSIPPTLRTAPVAMAQATNPRGPLILIVDDDENVLEIATEFVQRL